MKQPAHSPKLLYAACLCTFLMSSPVRGDLVTGNGEWESRSSVVIRGTWTVALERTGDDLKGTLTLTGSPLFAHADIAGTLEGDHVMFGTVLEGTNEVSFGGTVTDGRVIGEWDCEAVGDSGSWSGVLRDAGKRASPD
jgi:hypothetical protein